MKACLFAAFLKPFGFLLVYFVVEGLWVNIFLISFSKKLELQSICKSRPLYLQNISWIWPLISSIPVITVQATFLPKSSSCLPLPCKMCVKCQPDLATSLPGSFHDIPSQSDWSPQLPVAAKRAGGRKWGEEVNQGWSVSHSSLTLCWPDYNFNKQGQLPFRNSELIAPSPWNCSPIILRLCSLTSFQSAQMSLSQRPLPIP